MVVTSLLLAAAAYIQPPPARYAHPYRGPVQRRYMSMEELGRICPMAYACSYIGGVNGVCVMNLTRLPGQQAELERHEMAHCNGWAANHPTM